MLPWSSSKFQLQPTAIYHFTFSMGFSVDSFRFLVCCFLFFIQFANHVQLSHILMLDFDHSIFAVARTRAMNQKSKKNYCIVWTLTCRVLLTYVWIVRRNEELISTISMYFGISFHWKWQICAFRVKYGNTTNWFCFDSAITEKNEPNKSYLSSIRCHVRAWCVWLALRLHFHIIS